jgi:hypothetical protein
MAEPAHQARAAPRRIGPPTVTPLAGTANPLAPQSVSLLPAELDLTIYAGDDLAMQFTFVDAASAPIDMSGTWSASIKPINALETDPPLQTFTVDASNAATGVIVISLTGAETGGLPAPSDASLAWDIQRTDPNGVVRTTHRGTISVVDDVTPP